MLASKPAEPVGHVRETAGGDDAKEPEEAHDGHIDDDADKDVRRRDEEKDDKAGGLV